MCDYCEERCCLLPLRWTSFGVGVLELLVYACTFVVCLFTVPDTDLSRVFQWLQYVMHVTAFFFGIILIIGALTENQRLVLVHVIAMLFLSITLPLLWLDIARSYKGVSVFQKNEQLRKTILCVIYATLFVFWVIALMYYRQLDKDLKAPVLSGTVRSGQTSWNYLTRMSSKSKAKDKEKLSKEAITTT